MAMCLSRPIGMPCEENVLTLSCNPFSWSTPIRHEIRSISVNYLNKRWFKPSKAAVSQTSMFSWRVRWKFSSRLLWLHHNANAVCSVYSITLVGLGCWLVRFVDEYLCCGYLRSSVDESGRGRERKKEWKNERGWTASLCVVVIASYEKTKNEGTITSCVFVVVPDERRLKQAIVSNSTKTSMTTATKPKESTHSIDNLNKISSYANLTSSMLFLPASPPPVAQPSYINQETVVRVMQQQLLKKETLSDTTSISSSSTSSPIVHVRHRSHLPPPPALEQQKQLAEDGSSSGDSTASSHRDSGLSSGINDGSSDGSPRGSLIEHESIVMDNLIKQTQHLFSKFNA